MSTQPSEIPQVPADTFELRLVIARVHAGRLTAEDAGALVGVSGQAWRNWEAGQSSGARRPAMLAFIAKRLGVDEEWLRNGGPLDLPPDPGPNGGADGHPSVTVSDFDFVQLLAA